MRVGIRRSLAAAAAIGAVAAASPSAVVSEDTLRTARALCESAAGGTRAAEWVASLTDRAGPRLAGSAGDRESIAWGLETLRALGFERVRSEPVRVRVWRREAESGEVVAPHRLPLVLTALGGSVATPAEGLEAEVLRVRSLEELESGDAAPAAGRIVFFDKKMERAADGSGYGRAVDVRSHGASRAARHGAIGVLIRSIGTDENRLPHTGGLDYEEGAPRIPAAALAIPDAELIGRLIDAGATVRVRFRLACGDAGEAESANVIGEVTGKSKPDEIVLLGAHRDSWDLGNGAIDDAAGCGIVIEAARRIRELARRPARTIRVVLYANEENGGAGGKEYARAHAAELGKHAAALEADAGSGRPRGLSWLAGPSAAPLLSALAPALAPAGAETLFPNGSGGADLTSLRAAGVPVFAVLQDATRYFDYHHTANDTLDKIERDGLDRTTAAVAAFAYAAADLPDGFERVPQDLRTQPRR